MVGLAGRERVEGLGEAKLHEDGRLDCQRNTDQQRHHYSSKQRTYTIEANDRGTTETNVMLQGYGGVGHLAIATLATQLPRQLSALREARGTERVALGDQAARGVDDPLATIGDVARVDEPGGLAVTAQAKSLVGNELVAREAVVELDHLHVVGREASGTEDLLRSLSGHVSTDHLYGRRRGGEGGGGNKRAKNSTAWVSAKATL